jgi:cyclic pyranopterin monophosphate synthase
MEQDRFTHLDRAGRADMVDVSAKAVTRREAVASCVVTTSASLADVARGDGVDPVLAARLAGIHAAKSTGALIPLCHPLPLERVAVELTPVDGGYRVVATAVATARTGVEMEALAACGVAALSVVTSLLGVDPRARVDGLALDAKSGGRSGDWGRSVDRA